jgi:Spy/CpxP family protein refolding chaperone
MKLGMRALALTALLAAPLAAQQPMESDSVRHAHGGMMGPGMMEHGMMGPGMTEMMMMGGMEYEPAHLLAINSELSLTAQQITALTALRDGAKRSHDAAMDRIKTHLDELRSALDAATPDTTAIRTHFLAAHDAMGQAHLAMLITNVRAKALLTDAQRAQVAQMRHGMMEGRRRGGPGAVHGRPAMRGI